MATGFTIIDSELRYTAGWHFFLMIIASLLLLLAIIKMLANRQEDKAKGSKIFLSAFITVVVGMLIGRYGNQVGLPWWIYYTVPMLMTLLIPPLVLKFDRKKTMLYLLMSLASAPLIHVFFSFVLGWKEYMPFWNIPSFKELIH